MKTFNINNYSQIIKKHDAICSCRWGTLYPQNFKEGKTICKHLKQVFKLNVGIQTGG